jgi:hypothetical protein
MKGELQLADTANLLLVCTNNARDAVVTCITHRVLTRAEALNMAGWIVALLDPEEKEFKPLLEAIKQA